MDKYEQTRLAAEADLEQFIRLVHPQRVLGAVHTDLIKWMTRKEAKSHRLVLLPRDHQKSAIAAYYVAWKITRNPAIRVLYISSTSNLATKQLKYIKDILTSSIYKLFWPEMVNTDESKREKWTESEISVDHPRRKEEIVRDPTVFTAGLTTNIVGLHCDLTIMDDVVTAQNAFTEDGREKTEQQYSHLASIEGTEGEGLVVGTRYDPRDLYNTILQKKIQIVDAQGEILSEEELYEVYEKAVEDRGDGTGEFLWPRQLRSDGRWFGFNATILATKKSQYSTNLTQFYAQYYNNPNMGDNQGIDKECFQYYSKAFLSSHNNNWFFKDRRLNIFAAMDFAYTTKKQSDYTAIVVVGIDCYNNYYVLDIDRFKTGNISEYYDHLLKLHLKWNFYKVKAETTAAQEVIVNDLKLNYIRPNGLALSIESYKPNSYEGSKEERIEAVLQPRYENRQMWHYLGGNCQILEEELVYRRPAHDDIKDALATAVDMCIPPTATRMYNHPNDNLNQHIHQRFGGIA